LTDYNNKFAHNVPRQDGRLDGLYITTDELDRLYGVPHLVFRLYLALLQRRDFITGLVGARSPHISWQALREMTEVESHPGIARDAASKNQLRRAAAWLERRGLVEMRSNPNQWHLIFFLPMARRGFFVSKKADTNPTGEADRGLYREKHPKADIPDTAEADTHRGSVYKHVRRGATRAAPGESPGELLQYPPSLTAAEKADINELIRRHRLNGQAQAALDELAGAIEKGAIQKKTGYFVGIAKKIAAGTFTPDKGKAIAARRARSTQETPTAPAETRGAPVASKAQARAAIAAVKAMMKDKGVSR
jgi:hypothetical protein